MSSSEQDQALYQVTAQSRLSKFQGGETLDGTEVRFTIPGLNVSDSVWIAGSNPDPETVREMIRARVATAYEIAALQD